MPMKPDATQNPLNSDQVLQNILRETIREQRAKRRWGIFFKLFFIAVVLLIIWGSIDTDSITAKNSHKKHIAEIFINNEIAPSADANAADLIDALNSAERDPLTQAIILDINSPGGSPVQASYVYNEVVRLRTAYPKTPIYAVCEDLCASAAYYIASSADKIYANPTSLVGSIGVLMDEFGFVDVLKKVGVTRRLFTSGEHKGFLDPFSPLKDSETAHIQQLLDDDHAIFINDVKKGRGARLSNDPRLFSGLIWNGRGALSLGLIDGFGSSADVARLVFKNDNLVDYTTKRNVLDKLLSTVSSQFFHAIKNELLSHSFSWL